ncbi:MAG: threonine aldolase family protein [Rhodospirillaceae bacterium]|jgi:threonine aldolase|nr:threonine aldolase family protein [Rhodospirillaceae bacterium]
MTPIRIDLHSDTQTRPSAEMRDIMANADVGDEQMGEDPSVNQLQEMVAELLGKEAALFLPSGTMCNLIALSVHCRSGDEIMSDRTAHILNVEGAGAAVIGGSFIRPLDGENGIFSADQVRASMRSGSRYGPVSRVVSIEQTSNGGGGTVWPLATIKEVAATAGELDLIMHMDGARLLNAAVSSGVSAKDFSDPFESVWIDLSKGLGCPIGGVLAGSADFIKQSWRWKQRLGGAMRQAGIAAAAGIYALENNVERMAEDHDNARLLAERLANLGRLDINLETVQSNLVFFDVKNTGMSGADMEAKLAKHGVRISNVRGTRMRAVTHLDVSRDQVEEAADAVRKVLEET